jgi:hypothetical protein
MVRHDSIKRRHSDFLFPEMKGGRHALAAYCGYGASLKPIGAAKAGSPDCLAWPRGTARAFPALPPDPVRRGDAGLGRPGRQDLLAHHLRSARVS